MMNPTFHTGLDVNTHDSSLCYKTHRHHLFWTIKVNDCFLCAFMLYSYFKSPVCKDTVESNDKEVNN